MLHYSIVFVNIHLSFNLPFCAARTELFNLTQFTSVDGSQHCASTKQRTESLVGFDVPIKFIQTRCPCSHQRWQKERKEDFIWSMQRDWRNPTVQYMLILCEDCEDFCVLKWQIFICFGARLIHQLPDIIARYWPITNISVSAYMFSDICRYWNCFLR